jgi:hypothetical protein
MGSSRRLWELITMSRVQETLAAWREAERRLEAADNSAEIAALELEVERLRQEYLRAVDSTDNEEDTNAAQFVGRPKWDVP